MEFKAVEKVTRLRVQDLTEPFEAVYLGERKGDFRTNYRFFSEDRIFEIFGTSSLEHDLKNVQPGHAVIIEFAGERDLGNGKVFYETNTKVSTEPVPAFDLTRFQDTLPEDPYAEGFEP